MKDLISHRFRGFSHQENTINGLKAALDFGVVNLEFDIRVAKCGTPMIYHDEYARAKDGKKYYLKNVMATDFSSLGGVFTNIPTADALFQAAANHTFQDARLLVDIKDAGFEEEIHALICLHRLQKRVIYVSWLPDVLYNMHDIAPGIPLCFSHWCKRPGNLIRARHSVFDANQGHIPRRNRGYTHGKRIGWYVSNGLRGDLREIIKKTGGSVCVPQNMVNRDLVEDYHKDKIELSTFSYVSWPKINDHKKRFNIDLYFIDNKKVFDEIGR